MAGEGASESCGVEVEMVICLIHGCKGVGRAGVLGEVELVRRLVRVLARTEEEHVLAEVRETRQIVLWRATPSVTPVPTTQRIRSSQDH